jgi:hypothetical protein
VSCIISTMETNKKYKKIIEKELTITK